MGKSAFGNTMAAGKAFKDMSMQNRRTGPSNKNLGPSRVARPNPVGEIRTMAGKAIKGMDKGAGTS